MPLTTLLTPTICLQTRLSLIATCNSTDSNHLSTDSSVYHCHLQLYWLQPSVYKLVCLSLPLATLLTPTICLQTPLSLIATYNSTVSNHLSTDSSVSHCHLQLYWLQPSVYRLLCLSLPLATLLTPTICLQTRVSRCHLQLYWLQPSVYRLLCPSLPLTTLLTPTICVQSRLSFIATCNTTDSNHLSTDSSVSHCHLQLFWLQPSVYRLLCLSLPLTTLLTPTICLQTPLSLIATYNSSDSNHLSLYSSVSHCHLQLYRLQPSVYRFLCLSLPLSTLLTPTICLQTPLSLIATYNSSDSNHLSPDSSVSHCHLQLFWLQPSISILLSLSLPLTTLQTPTICLQIPLSLIATYNSSDSNHLSTDSSVSHCHLQLFWLQPSVSRLLCLSLPLTTLLTPTICLQTRRSLIAICNSTDYNHLSPDSSVSRCHLQLYWLQPSVYRLVCLSLPFATLLTTTICLQTPLSLVATYNSTDSNHLSTDSSVSHCHLQLYWLQPSVSRLLCLSLPLTTLLTTTICLQTPLSLIATYNSTDSNHLSLYSSVSHCHLQLYRLQPSVYRFLCLSLPLTTLLTPTICLQTPLSLIATYNSTDSNHLSTVSSVYHCHLQLYWLQPSNSILICLSLPLATLLTPTICLQTPLSLIATYNSTDSNHLSTDSSVPHCHLQLYWLQPSVSRLVCLSLPRTTLLTPTICLQTRLSLIATYNSTDSNHLSLDSSVPRCYLQLYWLQPSVYRLLCLSLPLTTLLTPTICLQIPLSLIATYNSTDSNHLSPDSFVPHCHLQLYWLQSSVYRLVFLSLPLATLLTPTICLHTRLSLIATYNSTDSNHLSTDSSVSHCHLQLYWLQPSVYRLLCPSLPLTTLLSPTICLQTPLSLIATYNSTDSNHLSTDSSVYHCHLQLYWLQPSVSRLVSLVATYNSTDSNHLSTDSSVPHCHLQLYWLQPSVSILVCPSLPLATLLTPTICLQTPLSLIATYNSSDSNHLSTDSSVSHCHLQLFWLQPSVSRLLCLSLPLTTLLTPTIYLYTPLSLIATYNSTDSNHLSTGSSVSHCHLQLYWLQPSVYRLLCLSLPLTTLLTPTIYLYTPHSLIATYNSTDSNHLSPDSFVPHCHLQLYWLQPSVSRLVCLSLPPYNSTDSNHLSTDSSVSHCHLQLYWLQPSFSRLVCPSLLLTTLLTPTICLQIPLSLIATYNSTDSNHLSPDSFVPHCHLQLYWLQPSVYRLVCLSLPLATLLTPTICLQTRLSLIATCNSTDSNHLSTDSSVPHCHLQLYCLQPSVYRLLCLSLPLTTLLTPTICLQTPLSIIATCNSTDSNHLSPDSCLSLPLTTLLTPTICLQTPLSLIATYNSTDSNHLCPVSSVLHCHLQHYWLQPSVYRLLCLSLPLTTLLTPTICLQTPLSLIATYNSSDSNHLSPDSSVSHCHLQLFWLQPSISILLCLSLPLTTLQTPTICLQIPLSLIATFNSTDSNHLSTDSSVSHCHLQLFWLQPSVSRLLCLSLPLTTLLTPTIYLYTPQSLIATYNSTDSNHLSTDSSVSHCHL